MNTQSLPIDASASFSHAPPNDGAVVRRLHAYSAGLVVLATAVQLAAAGDYTYVPRCGIDWEAVCQGSECGEGIYWHYNNWGGEACGAAPYAPGPIDTAHIPLGQVRVFNDNVSIGSIDVGVDGSIFIDALVNRHRYLYLVGPQHFNDGTITINEPNGSGGCTLFALNPLTISGEGTVVLDRYHGYELGNLDSAEGVVLTNGPGHTIRGRGHIRAALANEGQVSGDVNGSILHLLGQSKTNAGTIEARNGGQLYLDAVTLTQSPTGRLLADGGTVSLRGGVTISGGHIGTADGGGVEAWFAGTGGNTFEDVTIDPGGNVYVEAYNNNSHCYLYLSGTSLINHGTLRVAHADETGRDTVRALSDVTVSGEGAIVLDRYHAGEAANLDTADGVTLTNAVGHTIRGHGHIRAALANEGMVRADVEGSVLHLLGQDKSNNGTMEARNGGLLYLEGFTLSQSPAGRVLADGGTVSLRGNAKIAGGHVSTANGGGIELWFAGDGGNTFENVTIDAGSETHVEAYNNNSHSYLFLTGTTLVNHGVIRIAGPDETGRCTVRAGADVTVSGQGSIVLDRYHSAEIANLDTAEGVTLTNAAGHTIRGLGHIHASILNHGTIAVDTAGHVITMIPKAPGVTNEGGITIAKDAHLELRDATLFHQAAGTCLVDGKLTASVAPLDLRGGVLSGTGTVAGDVKNSAATVEPGSPLGLLTIGGDYVQDADGRCRIEIAGTEPGVEHDTLAVTGGASLAGTLEVALLPGYRPKLGHSFTALTFGARTGAFESIDGQDLGGGKFMTVFHKTTSVELVVSECIDMANFKPKGKRGKVSFKLDTPLADKEKVTITATDTSTGDEYNKTRKVKGGRARGSIPNLPAGNYDVCVTKTPHCGKGCFEETNVDVS